MERGGLIRDFKSKQLNKLNNNQPTQISNREVEESHCIIKTLDQGYYIFPGNY